jgi:hypothetical protein
LEYINNYLTPEGIAEAYSIPESHAIILINAGRIVNQGIKPLISFA